MMAHLKTIATLSVLLGLFALAGQHPEAAALTILGVMAAFAFALIYLLILEVFQD